MSLLQTTMFDRYAKYDTLTSRELDIIKVAITGASVKEMAEKMMLSPSTIRSHLANIYGKMKVNNRAAMVQYVYENNILAKDFAGIS